METNRIGKRMEFMRKTFGTLILLLFSCASFESRNLQKHLDETINIYENLYRQCHSGTYNPSSRCDTIYLTLAKLYIDRDRDKLLNIQKNFNSTHPHIDSAYVVDGENLEQPRFESAIAIYDEIISKWGENSLNEESLFNFCAAVYNSDKNYEKASSLIDKFIHRFPYSKKLAKIDLMKAMVDFNIGNYDGARDQLNSFKLKYKTSPDYAAYLNEADKILSAIEIYKKYKKHNNL
jgi:outer membrane protein assembly factor BamD (BamD/ComL family)